MLEAMCCGTPVVGHDVGGIRDVIEDGKSGLLVPVGNPGAFAAAICQVALDTSARDRMAEVCRKEIPPRFGLETQANRYVALYQELISKGTGTRKGRGSAACRPGKWGSAFGAMVKSIPGAPSRTSFLGRLLDKMR
jgi:hypothetical protein